MPDRDAENAHGTTPDIIPRLCGDSVDPQKKKKNILTSGVTAWNTGNGWRETPRKTESCHVHSSRISKALRGYRRVTFGYEPLARSRGGNVRRDRVGISVVGDWGDQRVFFLYQNLGRIGVAKVGGSGVLYQMRLEFTFPSDK